MNKINKIAKNGFFRKKESFFEKKKRVMKRNKKKGKRRLILKSKHLKRLKNLKKNNVNNKKYNNNKNKLGFSFKFNFFFNSILIKSYDIFNNSIFYKFFFNIFFDKISLSLYRKRKKFYFAKKSLKLKINYYPFFITKSMMKDIEISNKIRRKMKNIISIVRNNESEEKIKKIIEKRKKMNISKNNKVRKIKKKIKSVTRRKKIKNLKLIISENKRELKKITRKRKKRPFFNESPFNEYFIKNNMKYPVYFQIKFNCLNILNQAELKFNFLLYDSFLFWMFFRVRDVSSENKKLNFGKDESLKPVKSITVKKQGKVYFDNSSINRKMKFEVYLSRRLEDDQNFFSNARFSFI